MLASLPAATVVSGDPAAAAVVFFALLIGHAVADFPLQVIIGSYPIKLSRRLVLLTRP